MSFNLMNYAQSFQNLSRLYNELIHSVNQTPVEDIELGPVTSQQEEIIQDAPATRLMIKSEPANPGKYNSIFIIQLMNPKNDVEISKKILLLI